MESIKYSTKRFSEQLFFVRLLKQCVSRCSLKVYLTYTILKTLQKRQNVFKKVLIHQNFIILFLSFEFMFKRAASGFKTVTHFQSQQYKHCDFKGPLSALFIADFGHNHNGNIFFSFTKGDLRDYNAFKKCRKQRIKS